MDAARSRKFEIAGGIALAGMVVRFLAVSWRKWPDPLVDFGRELYIPWRLAHGAVLFRDVDDLFGPLSQYFNAALFAVFDPGLMVLVAANLAVYVCILSVLYVLFRRAWGPGAAFSAAAVFVAVFSFSQFTVRSNYNYATPYSHETTHGFLVSLFLVLVLAGWIERATAARSFLAGALLGLTAVLKPEFLLAAGMTTALAAAIRSRNPGRLGRGSASAWIAGAALPTLAFAAYFAFYFPPAEALRSACRGWLNALASAKFSGDSISLGELGFDHPLAHLISQATSVLGALGLFGLLGGAAWAIERVTIGWVRAALAVVVVAALGCVAWFGIEWTAVGRCLLGLVALYGAAKLARFLRGGIPAAEFRAQSTRFLLAVLGAALMARMVLNGRIFHYGYCQAAVAGMLVPAILIGEASAWLGLKRAGRIVFWAGVILVIGIGSARLAAFSQRRLAMKTLAIGEGRDLFYAFPPPTDRYSDVVRVLSAYFRAEPADTTLLVLPEGQMINYLARKPSPLAPSHFYSGVLANGREARIVEQLGRHPPDYVVLIREDLKDHGIRVYGEKIGGGKLIVAWLMTHYDLAKQVPADSQNPVEVGGLVLRPKLLPP